MPPLVAEGTFLTDGRRLVEVRRVVLDGGLDGKGRPIPVARHVLVVNALSPASAPPDLIAVTDDEIVEVGWRNVKFKPFDLSKSKWEAYRGEE